MAESKDMIDVCDDLGIESFFFEHVFDRSEEICDENSVVSSEHRISTPGRRVLPYITWRVCADKRGRDFEAPDLERGIHFRGVF